VIHQRNINVLDRTVTRLRDFKPSSFNEKSMTCEAVISTGSAVRREYGVERLEISKAAIDLSRLNSVGIPLLDSHNQFTISSSLGRVVSAKVRDGELLASIAFNETATGKLAAGMVARGEIGGISAGYRVDVWEIRDAAGNVVDPESNRWGGDDLEFVGVRWELFEISLVAIAADPGATVRSDDDRAYVFSRPACADVTSICARMAARSRMMARITRLESGKHYPPMTFFSPAYRSTTSIFGAGQRAPRLIRYGR
jgi:phage head maturation protease